ncbi:serine/threonine-protein kinase M1 [Polyrhizophydium stewartii]|uniref:non-specific serine/threonine protein kinase n=1 Tax=Polyrhizophydium stewartii TaxID=2732419 RepID=A0ABR4MVC5_9FUNG
MRRSTSPKFIGDCSQFHSHAALIPRDRIHVEIAEGKTVHAHGINKAAVCGSIRKASRDLSRECKLHIPGMADSFVSTDEICANCTRDSIARSLRFNDGTVHCMAAKMNAAKLAIKAAVEARAARIALIWRGRMTHTPPARLEQMARDDRVLDVADDGDVPLQHDDWWPCWCWAVNENVRSCDPCARDKGLAIRSFDWIIVVACRMVKMAHFNWCRKSCTAAQMADLFFKEAFCLHGRPAETVTDCGSQFTLRFRERLNELLATLEETNQRQRGLHRIEHKLRGRLATQLNSPVESRDLAPQVPNCGNQVPAFQRPAAAPLSRRRFMGPNSGRAQRDEVKKALEGTDSVAGPRHPRPSADIKMPAEDFVAPAAERATAAAKTKTSKAAADQTVLGEAGADNAKIWDETCGVASRLLNDDAEVVETALVTLHQLLVDNCSSFSADLVKDWLSSARRIAEQLIETCHCYTTSSPEIAHLCCRCLGALGAPSPDLFGSLFTVDKDFGPDLDLSSQTDATAFACALIEKKLVPLLESTHDARMSGIVALTIQKLLQYCNFTPDGVRNEGFSRPQQSTQQGTPANQPVTVKEHEQQLQILRHAWESVSKTTVAAIEPPVGAKCLAPETPPLLVERPVYNRCDSAREWISSFVLDIVRQMPTQHTRALFEILANVVVGNDRHIAKLLLPHVVLDVLNPGIKQHGCSQAVLDEVLAVLHGDPADKKFERCANFVFGLMDHLAKWSQLARARITKERNTIRRQPNSSGSAAAIDLLKERVWGVQSLFENVPHQDINLASKRAGDPVRHIMHSKLHIGAQHGDKSHKAKPMVEGV